MVVSNSDTPIIRRLYSRSCFKISTVWANRAINCNGEKRGKIKELIITSRNIGGAMKPAGRQGSPYGLCRNAKFRSKRSATAS